MNTHEPAHNETPSRSPSPNKSPPSPPHYTQYLPASTIVPTSDFSFTGIFSTAFDTDDTQSNMSSSPFPSPKKNHAPSSTSNEESEKEYSPPTNHSNLFALKYARYIDDQTDDDANSTISSSTNDSRDPRPFPPTQPKTNQRQRIPPSHRPPPPPPRRSRTESFIHQSSESSVAYVAASLRQVNDDDERQTKRRASYSKTSDDVSSVPAPPSSRKLNKQHTKSMSSIIQGFKNMSLSRANVLSKLDSSRSKKEIMNKLDASILSVEEALKDRVRNLMKYQDEKEECEKEMHVMLEKFEMNAFWNVVSAANSYYQNKLLYLDSEIEIAKLHCKCFSAKFKELRKVRSRLKGNESSYERDDLIFSVEAGMSTASNIRLPRRIHDLRSSADALRFVVDELEDKMKKEESECKREMTLLERQQHLVTILVRVVDACEQERKMSEDDDEKKKDDDDDDLEIEKERIMHEVYENEMYYHDASCTDEHGDQIAFEQMLFDQRFDEGKIISKWFKVVHKKNQNATVSNLSSFVKRLTSKMCHSCEITESSEFYRSCFPQCVYLMTCRSILSRMKGFIDYSETDTENDSIYNRRWKWMNIHLSPKEVHVDEIFACDRDEFVLTFGCCIDELKRINSNENGVMIAHDVVVSIVKSVKWMQMIASTKMKMRGEVNGDILFPIVVYCVICCGIVTWHGVFGWMEAFMPPSVMERGQTGFCTSLVRAAVGFVMQQTPENFGLNVDVN